MHEDHDVSRHARRKDTLSAEDLGILLQWYWKLHRVDAIVCATGFDITYWPRFKLCGRQGIPLSDLWADINDIEAYLALAVPGFPNYFSKAPSGYRLAGWERQLIVEQYSWDPTP